MVLALNIGFWLTAAHTFGSASAVGVADTNRRTHMAIDDRTDSSGSAPHGALVHAKDADDFAIPEGQPDPRGWEVKSADGTTLGRVEDLLFDTADLRVRYLEVRADGDLTKLGGREYFLLPIGTARVDEERDEVVVKMAADSLTGVPAYERGHVSREYEMSLRDYVRDRPGADRAASPGVAGQGMGSAAIERDVSFYGSAEYDDASFFSRGRGTRDRAAGDPSATGSSDHADRRF